jgi:cobalt-zinc-cadmium efflux system protein
LHAHQHHPSGSHGGPAHDHGHAGHGHAGHHHAPAATDDNRRRVLLAACLTGGFMAVEAVAGVLTGSLALIADAGHMLTDAVALTLAYAAYRIAGRPGNPRMTYGFDRLKILVAYTNGLTVLGLAIWIAVEAVQRILDPAPVLGAPMLAVAAVGLAVNLVVFAILHGGDRTSLNLRGALLHVMGDLLGSAAAIIAALVILTTGWTQADPLLSVLVAALLLRGAWTLLRESGLILLEGAPPHVSRNDIAADLASHAAGICDVHHMHVWTLDGRQLLATMHARLVQGADAEESIAAIKARLRAEHGIRHATVEIETGQACPDERDTQVRERGFGRTA